MVFFTLSVVLPPQCLKKSIGNWRKHTYSDVQSEKHHIFSKKLVLSLVWKKCIVGNLRLIMLQYSPLVTWAVKSIGVWRVVGFSMVKKILIYSFLCQLLNFQFENILPLIMKKISFTFQKIVLKNTVNYN
jgi:hypothetical protein